MRGLWLLLALWPAMGQVLTMEEAVARALVTNPELTAVRAARAVSAFQMQAARALPAPEVRVIANNFSLDPESSDLRNSVAFKWVPPRPGAIALQSRVVTAKRQVVDAEIREAEERVAAGVRQAYRRAAVAEERTALAAQVVALRKAALEVVRRQVASGLKEAVEVDLAELAVFDAEVGLAKAQGAVAAEKRRLGRLLEPSGTGTFSLVAEAAAPRRDVAGLVDRALASRADVARAAASCGQAEAARAVARNELYPWLSTSQVTRRIGALSGRTGAWGFQVGVELPLFRSAARAAYGISGAEAERCRLEERAVRVRARQEVEEAAALWAAALTELEKLEELANGPAARALAHTKAALAAGKADRVEVLVAEARQLGLRDRWLEKRLELAGLEAQLELAAGGRIPAAGRE